MRRVEVEWIDAAGSHAPAEEKGAFEAREIVSDGLVIPRGAIRAIRELRRR